MTPYSASRLHEHSPAWDTLSEHAQHLSRHSLLQLFEQDPLRFERLHRRAGPLLLDISKQRLTERTLEHLYTLAQDCDLSGWIERLFAGQRINSSENAAAMHWALRAPAGNSAHACVAEVHAQRTRMEALAVRLRDGHWRGFSGAPIRDVVCLGVGGSQLGPLMAVAALAEQGIAGPRVHFASGMDGLGLARLLEQLNPEHALFLVTSKSFTTSDTLNNAAMARDWLQRAGASPEDAGARHFIGISAFPERMHAWGIPAGNQLLLWDWLGGRYSLCSPVCLPLVIALGPAIFAELCRGAHFMDNHFRRTPWRNNLPVLLGLTDVWNRNFLDLSTRAVLPYDSRLSQLPAWLEQLEMESGGKSVSRDGLPLSWKTTPVVWAGLGLDAQHAFYQFLHQGSDTVACEFLVAAQPPEVSDPLLAHHLAIHYRHTLANCVANARALAFGDQALGDRQALAPQRRYPGNRPSTTLLLDDISAFTLGALAAMYEHKVFVQAVVWNINPFDQWGIELGKSLASRTLKQMAMTSGEGTALGMELLSSAVRPPRLSAGAHTDDD